LFVACLPVADDPPTRSKNICCIFFFVACQPARPSLQGSLTAPPTQPRVLFSSYGQRIPCFVPFVRAPDRGIKPLLTSGLLRHTHTHTHTARERLFLDFTSNSPPLLSVFFYYLSFACPGTFARPASSSVSHIKAQVAGVCVCERERERQTDRQKTPARERLFLDFTSNSPPLLSVFFYYLRRALIGGLYRAPDRGIKTLLTCRPSLLAAREKQKPIFGSNFAFVASVCCLVFFFL